MSATIRYPYDPVGDKSECKVVGERFEEGLISFAAITPIAASYLILHRSTVMGWNW